MTSNLTGVSCPWAENTPKPQMRVTGNPYSRIRWVHYMRSPDCGGYVAASVLASGHRRTRWTPTSYPEAYYQRQTHRGSSQCIHRLTPLQAKQAQRLTVPRFRDNLNQYLYNIALVHGDLGSARASSSLLTAAIFTVTALHVPQHHHLFPLLYQEFLASVSACMFNRYHRLDDVRGLCIGAFWLMEVSWKLSGHAVRIATEMNIHQAFGKAVSGSSQHFEQARLW